MTLLVVSQLLARLIAQSFQMFIRSAFEAQVLPETIEIVVEAADISKGSVFPGIQLSLVGGQLESCR